MYNRRTVRRNAIVDAKNNIPGRDDPNPSQFEQELMAMARNEARQVTTKYGPQLEILNGKHKPLLKDYERISKDYDAHAAKIERTEPSVELSRGKYYILMTLFVLGEIPMNSLAFAVFGESQIFTWIMAVGVAVAIPWIAHALGILLKRGSDPWWKAGIGVGALLFLTVGGLIAIGYVRVQYLGDLSTSGAVTSFASSKFIGAAFVGLNLVIFGYIHFQRQRFMPVLFDDFTGLLSALPVNIGADDISSKLGQDITKFTPQTTTTTSNHGYSTREIKEGMYFI